MLSLCSLSSLFFLILVVVVVVVVFISLFSQNEKMCFSINHQDFLPENLHMVTICSQSSVRPKKKNSTPPWVTELITVGLKSLHALCQSRLQHVLATPSKTILNHQMKSLNGCVTIIPYKSMDAEIVKFHANTETNYHLSH